MADLKDRVQQIGNAIVFTEAYTRFQQLANQLMTDKNVSISVKEGYLSEYDLVDQLRLLVNEPKSAPADIVPLLDPQKTMASIVSEGSFEKLSTFVKNTSRRGFLPPLNAPEKSYYTDKEIHEYPNYVDKDPRRTGRLFRIDGTDAGSDDVKKWIYNNSLLYGFLPYRYPAHLALYWVGIDKIKDQVKSKGVESVVGTYMKFGLADLITVTKDTVLNSNL